MADLLQIVDLADSAQVQISYISGTSEPETAPPANFSLPLSDPESAEIRWYFNEYPEDTFGEASARAAKVETGLKDLGLLLFQAVFGASDEAKSLLEKAGQNEQPLLSIVSTRPEFLGLPWELLNNGGETYLTSQLAGVSRRLSSEPQQDFSGRCPDGRGA